MQTAWLKAHYPREYMAAVLTSYTGKTEKIVHYIGACKFDGIDVLPPDVNQSGNEFTPVPEGIRFGLAGIRGVGEGVSDVIVAEREAHGPFVDIFDFVERLDTSKINRRVLESLVKAGAFDSTGYTRKQLCFLLSKDNPANILDAVAREQKNKASGQLSMFDLFDNIEDAGSVVTHVAPDGVEWDDRTKLTQEKEVLGIYVSDHPLRPYEYALSQVRDYALSDIDEGDEDTGYKVPEKQVFSWAGMVDNVQKKITKSGDQMAVFTLADMQGDVTCVCFPKIFAKKGAILFGQQDSQDDIFVKVRGNLDRSDRGNQIMVADIEPLVLDAVSNKPKVIEIRVNSSVLNQTFVMSLSHVLSFYPGRDNVELLIEESSGAAMRAELPLHVDAKNFGLLTEIENLINTKGTLIVT